MPRLMTLRAINKLHGGIPTPTIVCGAIALLLFVGAGFLWHRAKVLERLCKPVLEKPIYFDNGFAVNSAFKVVLAEKYNVEIACQRTSPIRIILPLSLNLPVKLAVSCNEDSIARVDSSKSLGGSFSAIEDTRTLTTFVAEPSKSYDFSFRVVGEIPALASTKSVVRICLPNGRHEDLLWSLDILELLSRTIAVVGLLFVLPTCILFMRKLIGGRIQQAN